MSLRLVLRLSILERPPDRKQWVNYVSSSLISYCFFDLCDSYGNANAVYVDRIWYNQRPWTKLSIFVIQIKLLICLMEIHYTIQIHSMRLHITASHESCLNIFKELYLR